jgi:hypothetical protein
MLAGAITGTVPVGKKRKHHDMPLPCSEMTINIHPSTGPLAEAKGWINSEKKNTHWACFYKKRKCNTCPAHRHIWQTCLVEAQRLALNALSQSLHLFIFEYFQQSVQLARLTNTGRANIHIKY